MERALAPRRGAARRADAPGGERLWLLDGLPRDFCLIVADGGPVIEPPGAVALLRIGEELEDADGVFASRFDASPGACFLVRPDHYLAGRWRAFDRAKVDAALARARA